MKTVAILLLGIIAASVSYLAFQEFQRQNAPELMRVIDHKQIQDRNDILYEVNSPDPFTGTLVVSHFKQNGQHHVEEMYANGKRKARIEYSLNGQKQTEQKYDVNGERVSFIFWHENGQMAEARVYIDGDFLMAKYWDQNGNLIQAEQ